MPNNDWERAARRDWTRRVLRSGKYYGGARQAEADREAKKAAKRAQRKPKPPKPKPPRVDESKITRCYIVCVDCGKRYTSHNPPYRVESRMYCRHCRGPVSLEHQIGELNAMV